MCTGIEDKLQCEKEVVILDRGRGRRWETERDRGKEHQPIKLN